MKKVQANSNIVKCRKNNKYLIKLPKTKFSFLCPQEYVHFTGNNNGSVIIYYTDDTQIHAFRYGKGQDNSRQIIDERYMSAGEWEQYFYQYKVN